MGAGPVGSGGAAPGVLVGAGPGGGGGAAELDAPPELRRDGSGGGDWNSNSNLAWRASFVSL